MDPLLARAALPVNGCRRSRHRKSRGEPCVATDVEALLSGLGHTTEHDVFDKGRVDARATHELFEHERTEDDRVRFLELSVSPTNRCADCFDDHGFAHLSGLLGDDVLRPILGAAPSVRLPKFAGKIWPGWQGSRLPS